MRTIRNDGNQGSVETIEKSKLPSERKVQTTVIHNSSLTFAIQTHVGDYNLYA